MSENPNIVAPAGLEGGTYEIIRKRLETQADELRGRLRTLNKARKEVFGAIETSLIANDRINTANYCLARDIVAVGQHCIFGYNVHIGLRSGINLEDVFSVYAFKDQRFQEQDLNLLANEKFQTDFQNLYRYYKDAYFARFAARERFLYMVFHLNQQSTDFKTFKWLLTDEGIQYIDNRSDHEVSLPNQYEFRWKRAGRDDQRSGRHPHMSIMDRVFVETVGGDLTIKVEDNTDDGRGIYREEVEYRDQTLDDAEYFYADLGNLIALKIRPYQEGERYFVFNEKMQKVERIDALGQSGVLLPDNQGLIFANGYYLQTGEYKIFDNQAGGLQFKKRIVSPNGEDYLYAFYDIKDGLYVLLHYNIIEQSVASPILCHGFTIFPDGELCYFRGESDPTKHHVIQIWQTPFVAGEVVPSEHTDSYLYKVGNKDLVRAMAECQEILTLTSKEDNYAGLYSDLAKRSTDVLDAYYWIRQEETFRLDEPLEDIRDTAQSAIEEYEKKVKLQKSTKAEIDRVEEKANQIFDQIKRQTFNNIDQFVGFLTDLRILRGEITGLKDLRYTNLELIEQLQEQAAEANGQLSESCVAFLLQEDALLPYQEKIDAEAAKIEELSTAKEAAEQEDAFNQIGSELEMLIEIVSNLKIDDATQTTRIIDQISGLFTQLNQRKAAVKKKLQSLRGTEATAEFNVQLKLLDQSIINYLDIADTPAKCDEYLTKLMVQLEELEGKFAEVDEFVTQLAEKREEVYSALESRKNSLVEARNNRTSALAKAADRILNGIQKRSQSFKEVVEINSFFAADLLIEKVRDIIERLLELEDSNKANSIQTKLKSLQEEAIRQLRDRQDLFVDGDNVIQMGRHKFSVNVQPLELTIVQNNGSMQYHLTGTNFYEDIKDEAILSTKQVWGQSFVSENKQVYRSEYLAYQLFHSELRSKLPHEFDSLAPLVAQEAARRYHEGYTKGIHDEDATRILGALLEISAGIGLLRFTPMVRACAKIFWNRFLDADRKKLLNNQLKSAGTILEVFPNTHEFDYLIEEIAQDITPFNEQEDLFPAFTTNAAAAYLFRELATNDQFVCSAEAADLYDQFSKYLKKQKAWSKFQDSLKGLDHKPREQYLLARKWVHAFIEQLGEDQWWPYQEELVSLLIVGDLDKKNVIPLSTNREIAPIQGDHEIVTDSIYKLNFHAFMDKLERYSNEVVPLYEQFSDEKRRLNTEFQENIQLDEFKPKVLSSFVRNRLIDEVYLPIFGDNLAKQIGTAGENTRTDRMGMLLLISPPGYGKTTLMEYVANRLGLIFMKINGPAIGHHVTSLAPADAPSMAAHKELEKLNLALEMGDNIMLYLDDIQHCHPEFLQKFISLCDAQRKIEGVYKGKAKTYDLRGRRVAVVMAGNPYTESGERFQIPDMLANRADIYNLGDIIGDSANSFKLSYIENALTSNPSLQQLAAKSMKDVYTLMKAIESQQMDGLDLEANHSPEELNEYVRVLEKLIRVRDIVLQVNQAYIRSAATADAYRETPAFKLQGSYRNMNKLAEKVVPIMNEEELQTLLVAHYAGESQTLTSDAEANFLQLKQIIGAMSTEDETRWTDILKTFNKNKRFGDADGKDRMGQLLGQLDGLVDGVEGIRKALGPKNES